MAFKKEVNTEYLVKKDHVFPWGEVGDLYTGFFFSFGLRETKKKWTPIF